MTSVSTLATLFFAQAAPSSSAGGIFGNPIIMPIALVVMFYFLLIRPQQKARKEQAARIAALQQGDKIVTSSGIYGLVHNIKETTVVIKVAESTMIEFDKNSIATVLKKEVK